MAADENHRVNVRMMVQPSLKGFDFGQCTETLWTYAGYLHGLLVEQDKEVPLCRRHIRD